MMTRHERVGLSIALGLAALGLGINSGWQLQTLAQESPATLQDPATPDPEPLQQLNLPPEPEPPPQPTPAPTPAETQPPFDSIRTEAIRSELRLLRQEVLNALLRIQALEALLDPTAHQQSSTQAEIIRPDAAGADSAPLTSHELIDGADPISEDGAVGEPTPQPTPLTLDVGTQTISLPGDVLFDFDRAELRPEAASLLRRVANRLSEKNSGRVVVTGHTDSIGDDNYNLVLSLDRANAVKDFLMGAIANANQFNWFASGYGASQPIASNDTEVGRQRNRRVDIIIAP